MAPLSWNSGQRFGLKLGSEKLEGLIYITLRGNLVRMNLRLCEGRIIIGHFGRVGCINDTVSNQKNTKFWKRTRGRLYERDAVKPNRDNSIEIPQFCIWLRSIFTISTLQPTTFCHNNVIITSPSLRLGQIMANMTYPEFNKKWVSNLKTKKLIIFRKYSRNVEN